MSSFLIVEDVAKTRKFLHRYLEQEFPGSRIDTAGTVEEARAVLVAARAVNVRYKVVILDFKIPARTGENPEIDTTLRREVLETTSPDAVVFHITAYPDDPEITKFLKDLATDPLQQRRSGVPAFFSKLIGSDWTENLYKTIRQVVHGDRIRTALDDLYPAANGWAGVTGRSTLQHHLTHDLAAVVGDIQQHWPWLDNDLRERIRSIFRVEDGNGKGIRVSLI